MNLFARSALFWLSLLASCAVSHATELKEVLPLTDRILMLHFDEGRVIHHQRGEPRSNEQVLISPLDTNAAAALSTYSVSSEQDPAYKAGRTPIKISRKSKGTDFAWFTDKWQNGMAYNERPDHTKEHWIYLFLPEPLLRGCAYRISTGRLATNGVPFQLHYDETRCRSEAVHVNAGYAPLAPKKFAYVYHWMGDRGGLDLTAYAGKAFQLLDEQTRKPIFTGKLTFRAPATQQETAHKSDSPPNGNFLKADVYECDFSSFTNTGRFVVAVDGVGCSFPFAVAQDVYREPFRIMARGLYHNRSGIALDAKHTPYTRPAPHNPKLTPGFSGKLIYTTVRFTEWGSEGGDSKMLLANSKGPLDAWGWYQDAGDWDSYYSHLRVPKELLLAYELAPNNFKDSELNIPESGNGIPDVLDEAAWLPRFLHRLRHELLRRGYGTGGVGLRVAGDAFGPDDKVLPGGKHVGQGSWEDVNRTWAVSGEDPWSTYGYAGVAANLAYCLSLSGAKDLENVDWAAEAKEAFAWAREHTRAGDEAKGPSLKAVRAYAAASLLRLSGEVSYQTQLQQDTADISTTTILTDDRQDAPFIAALGGGKMPDSEVRRRLRSAVLATADDLALSTVPKRALRWAGNWYMPMIIGQQTTPLVLPIAVGHAVLSRARENPAKASDYLAALFTTCDYFLGCNALNTTWITGFGPRHPEHVFHMDAWYNGKGEFHPGVIPYGPWRKEKDLGQGPWDVAWPHKTLHPPIDDWPGNERWFDNGCSPLNSEFTVHQNTGPAAAIYGYLCAPTSGKAVGR